MNPLFVLFLTLLSFAWQGCRHVPSGTMKSDLFYTSPPSPRQQGDLYLPEGPGPHPIAIVIHGGGWSGRDRSDMNDISRRLAANGIAAFNINYRLAPEHRFPAQLEDVFSAMEWITDQATSLNLNINRMYTVGYSAGAHLSLLAAAEGRPGLPDIKGVIAGGAPTDLTLYPNSPYVQKLMGASFENDPEAFRAASPLHQVGPTHPPVFLYHGSWDKIVAYKNSTLLVEALLEAGVKVELHTRHLEGHILTYFRESPSIKRGIQFLESLE